MISHRYWVWYILTSLAAIHYTAGDAAAQSDDESTQHDVGSWLTLGASGNLGGSESRFSWYGMGQLRLLENSAGYHVGVGYLAAGYQLSSSTNIRFGGAVFHFHPDNADDVLERRLSQEIVWSNQGSPLRVVFHGRIEERFFSSGDDMGLRFRLMLRLSRPVTSDERFGIEGFQESWISALDTDWGASSGYSQNRVYLGGYWVMNTARTATFRLGYMNQLLLPEGRGNIMRHLLMLTTAFRL